MQHSTVVVVRDEISHHADFELVADLVLPEALALEMAFDFGFLLSRLPLSYFLFGGFLLSLLLLTYFLPTSLFLTARGFLFRSLLFRFRHNKSPPLNTWLRLKRNTTFVYIHHNNSMCNRL